MLITDLSAIGTRIRQIRKYRKLSQAEVAASTGISGRAYADIERGNTNMRVDTMLGICQALNISPNEIFADNKRKFTFQQQELVHQLDTFSDEEKRFVFELLHIVKKLMGHNQIDFSDNSVV